ncbi:MAG: DUF4377 domain-containing protein [Tenacibaculum sp.]
MIDTVNAKIHSIIKLVSSKGSNKLNGKKQIIVASKKTSEGLLFKENDEDDWRNFDRLIDGFVYEDGYEYELLISDQSKIKNNKEQDCTLIRVLTKTKKTSCNLPN